MTLAEFAASSQGWAFGLTCLVGLVQLLVLWVLWSLRKAFVTPKVCEDCRKACRAQVDARLNTQEASTGELGHAVAQAAPMAKVAEVDKADETLRGDIKALVATVNGLKDQQGALARQVSLLMQHHLSGGSR